MSFAPDYYHPHANVSPHSATPPFRRVFTGAMAGAYLQWYDFAVYGILAATVLGQQFFPGDNAGMNVLFALATHGIGFLARPLGGIVLGHLGDRYGRKPMLLTTFGLLSAATAAIGLLPTYEQIGILATALLVFLRMVQGFALGGEFGAAVVLVGEHCPAGRRGLWAALPQAGGPGGTLLAAGMVAALSMSMPAEAFSTWGWRLAFLIMLPLLLLVFWMRSKVDESPLYERAKLGRMRGSRPKSSILMALSKPAAVFQGLFLRIGENFAYYFYTAFVVGYATQSFDYGRGDVVLAVTFASFFQFVGMVLGGWWSDSVGRRAALITPAILLVIWSPLFFVMVSLETLAALWIGISVGALFQGLLAGPEAAWIVERFPTQYRFAGSSLVFQVSSIFAGASAPFLALWLINLSGAGAVMACGMLMASLSAIAVALGPETKASDLSAAEEPSPRVLTSSLPNAQ